MTVRRAAASTDLPTEVVVLLQDAIARLEAHGYEFRPCVGAWFFSNGEDDYPAGDLLDRVLSMRDEVYHACLVVPPEPWSGWEI